MTSSSNSSDLENPHLQELSPRLLQPVSSFRLNELHLLLLWHETEHLTSSLTCSGSSGSDIRQEGGGRESGTVLSSSMQVVLSMGFSYLQVIEAYSIFGDDVDSMICYLLEMSSGGRNKGKATEK